MNKLLIFFYCFILIFTGSLNALENYSSNTDSKVEWVHKYAKKQLLDRKMFPVEKVAESINFIPDTAPVGDTIISVDSFFELFHGTPSCYVARKIKLLTTQEQFIFDLIYKKNFRFMITIMTYPDFKKARQCLLDYYLFVYGLWSKIPEENMTYPVGNYGLGKKSGVFLTFIRYNLIIHIDLSPHGEDDDPSITPQHILELGKEFDDLLTGKAQFLLKNSSELVRIQQQYEACEKQKKEEVKPKENVIDLSLEKYDQIIGQCTMSTRYTKILEEYEKEIISLWKTLKISMMKRIQTTPNINRTKLTIETIQKKITTFKLISELTHPNSFSAIMRPMPNIALENKTTKERYEYIKSYSTIQLEVVHCATQEEAMKVMLGLRLYYKLKDEKYILIKYIAAATEKK